MGVTILIVQVVQVKEVPLVNLDYESGRSLKDGRVAIFLAMKDGSPSLSTMVAARDYGSHIDWKQILAMSVEVSQSIHLANLKTMHFKKSRPAHCCAWDKCSNFAPIGAY